MGRRRADRATSRTIPTSATSGSAPAPQGYGVLATTFLPPPINGGSGAGDIILNSNMNFGTTGYDLETVVLHEIGHALGLNESTVTTSVMYGYYNGVKQSLTSDDTSGIQSLYGTLPTRSGNNASFATATNITGNINGNLQIDLGGLAVDSTTDYHFYEVTVPTGTSGTMVVQMQSSNLSSLAPRVVVYNSAEHGLAQAMFDQLWRHGVGHDHRRDRGPDLLHQGAG